jgi:hypothetical protein
MKKYSMETIVDIFVVSEGFLPDFTGWRDSYLVIPLPNDSSLGGRRTPSGRCDL